MIQSFANSLTVTQDFLCLFIPPTTNLSFYLPFCRGREDIHRDQKERRKDPEDSPRRELYATVGAAACLKVTLWHPNRHLEGAECARFLTVLPEWLL